MTAVGFRVRAPKLPELRILVSGDRFQTFSIRVEFGPGALEKGLVRPAISRRGVTGAGR